MAYNNFYSGYNSPYYQQVNPYQINQAQPIQQNQVNSGFINVRSAQEAYNYPVAPGASVTFKDETAPFIYVKTRGFNQLEEPVFEQFQLVKVDNSQKTTDPAQTESPEYALKADITALQSEIDLLKKKISEYKLAVNESEE
jgi:hypothetical protein